MFIRLKRASSLLSSFLSCLLLATVIMACSSAAPAAVTQPSTASTLQSCSSAHACIPVGFQSQFAMVNGVRLHYVIGGQGTPLVLLHGWPETWYAWRLVMPMLMQNYKVIVPDLRGLGDSSKPATGYDTRAAAEDIYQLVQHLGYQQIDLVGHDLGGWVAYTYAARHGAAVRRLITLDVIPPNETLLQFTTLSANSNLWHFSFHNVPDLPEELVAGKERIYLSWFYQHFAYDPHAITKQAIDEYVRCYSAPGGMRAGFAYYRALFTDIAQNKEDFRTKLSMPVLIVTSLPQGGNFYLNLMHQYATNVSLQTVTKAGHWIPEEQPAQLSKILLSFFATA